MFVREGARPEDLCLVMLWGASASAASQAEAGSGWWGVGGGMETGSPGLALQVLGLPFPEHSNELLYPRGPVGPDVTRWGWGRSPASGLAASDKKPREEFPAPFNTVIIFLLSVGGGCFGPECRHPSLQEDAPGWQVCRVTSQAEPKPGRAL